ncbi:MAG: HD superfamily phosphohydrolase [Salibacteraceae bacterium]|jgi:HD superfamily phosphohydrolase
MSDLTNIKNKIFNDPLYGFISIHRGIIYDVIEHPWFQRLRRINQLGLTNVVYTGANHTRFQHTLGAYHLMTQAIAVIRQKGHVVTDKEAEGVYLAILLHDIGHGPFSHTLENSIIEGVSHEDISIQFMKALSKEFNGALDLAIEIFTDTYPKTYLHQLVSSQLDMDRLDYLMRDSFFTGVSEGVVGSERIIQMLDVSDGNLVIEAKGIYSIEKFIISRRLMYWQVYLHKTVLSAENLLVRVMNRAAQLTREGKELFASPALLFFMKSRISKSDFENNPEILKLFSQLDDFDVISAIKVWQNSEDKVLSLLAQKLIKRQLLKVKFSDQAFSEDLIAEKQKEAASILNLNKEEAKLFVLTGKVENRAFKPTSEHIDILHKDGSVRHIGEDAALLNISVLSEPVVKHYLCFPVS